jgi:hypothetical protein
LNKPAARLGSFIRTSFATIEHRDGRQRPLDGVMSGVSLGAWVHH